MGALAILGVELGVPPFEALEWEIEDIAAGEEEATELEKLLMELLPGQDDGDVAADEVAGPELIGAPLLLLALDVTDTVMDSAELDCPVPFIHNRAPA